MQELGSRWEPSSASSRASSRWPSLGTDEFARSEIRVGSRQRGEPFFAVETDCSLPPASRPCKMVPCLLS